MRRPHQPFPVPLESFHVQQLDRNGLSLEPRPQLIIDVALVHRAESSLAEQVIAGEVVGYRPQLAELKRVQPRPEGVRQLLVESSRGRAAELRG